jgi:hypothetical protein
MPAVSRSAAKDFNGDGNADLVWENSTTGERAIWFMKNGAVASTAYLPMISPGWHIAAVADLNGDGVADLVWEDTKTGDHAVWFFQNGAVSSTTYLQSAGAGWHLVGAGHFNGAGRAAGLIWENTDNGNRAIWFFENGTVVRTALLESVPPEWHIVAVGDFDGDGVDDIVWENTRTGENAIWFMRSGGIFNGTYGAPTRGRSIYLSPVPAGWHIAGAADFNNDGNADLVWENTSTGAHGIWLMKNGILTSSISLTATPLTWRIVNH